MACTALLAACAGLRPAVQTPRLGLADLEVIDFGLFEQRYRLRLRVQNPNPNALHIRGLDYTLHINEQEFARGVSNQAVKVPAFGEALVEIDLVSSLAGLVAQLDELSSNSANRLPYRLSGRVTIGSFGQGRLFGLIPLSRSLPFDYQGELSFPQLKHVSRGRTF
jgi:LEA14-like dessication related protein